jgi:superfamily II DNA/RNA helicase
VAARGIDVEGITHVINFQCPEDEKTYLHRIGRTARAGADGIAVTFVDWDELARWKMIDTALELGLPEPIETYSSSDHLYEVLSIPTGSTGRLVAAAKVEAPVKSDRGARTSAPKRATTEKREPAKAAPREKSARVRTRTKRVAE